MESAKSEKELLMQKHGFICSVLSGNEIKSKEKNK